MTSSFLGRHYDGAAEIPDTSKATIVEEEIARIAHALAIVIFASSLPRRLGGEATDEELAEDKRRCRRVVHALQNVYLAWTGKKTGIKLPVATEEIKQAAAQLLWDRFKEQHISEVKARCRITATWAIKNNEERWGKSAVVNYENEIRWLEYALR